MRAVKLLQLLSRAYCSSNKGEHPKAQLRDSSANRNSGQNKKKVERPTKNVLAGLQLLTSGTQGKFFSSNCFILLKKIFFLWLK